MKSVESRRSVSALINDLVRERLSEDAEDLQAFRDRADEPVISYERLVEELRSFYRFLWLVLLYHVKI